MSHIPPRRTSPFPIEGELQAALDRLLQQSEGVAPNPIWLDAIARIGTTLGADSQSSSHFLEAWRVLYTLTLYLDHLQDGDALGALWLEALAPPLQYQLAFSLYIAAQHALARLDLQDVPASRIVRLQRFWAESVARLANGQYQDLTFDLDKRQAERSSPLKQYEQVAAQKTGATFALAFGGVAILATDDEIAIAALATAGTIYGMLVQYHDDLRDDADQEHQPTAPTLARALLAAHPDIVVHGQGGVHTFWATIYASYAQALERVLAPLPAETRGAFTELVQRSFGEPSAAMFPTTGAADGKAGEPCK
jgi:hypothetical protein